jgi:sialate O-acetylesterase
MKKERWQMKRRFGLNLFLLWCFVPLTSSASANVRLPAIVSDNMILQQRIGAPIWGWANPGETVTVAGSWCKEASATAGNNGKWKVCLNTPPYGGPYTLTIKGKNEITIDNVMIGEVWLCAGTVEYGMEAQRDV